MVNNSNSSSKQQTIYDESIDVNYVPDDAGIFLY